MKRVNPEGTDPRVMDPAKGAFCEVNKSGIPVNLPPTTQEPPYRHVDKTRQDHMAKDQRPRVQLAQRQAAWIQTHKPRRSGDYLRMPRS